MVLDMSTSRPDLSNLSTTELRQFAAGVGAQKKRWGVTQRDSVRFAIIEYPALAGYEADIKRGWSNEERAVAA